MDTRPFYPHSFGEAKRNGEEETYVLSHQANVDCKNAIEQAIRDNYDGYSLGKDLAKPVIEQFGFDRVKYVLADTVQHFDNDGRISRDNKAWAKETFVPEDKIMGRDRRTEFLLSSHTGLADLFINQYKREYDKLNLWDKTQVNDPKDLNFEGKIMVLKPEILSEQHKTREEQLFYAYGGFGCSPDKNDRKVMGEFLVDGEKTNFYRQDFLGEARTDLLPDWAKEKLADKTKDRKPSVLQQLKENKEQSKAEKPLSIKDKKQDKGER
ncbi:DUF3849 domain-containing protein [Anaerotignum sp.]|uniref:DUF3849 domain-containing protein n=1 Tax=Anaerotignum sp. TaxID=2039241 RepID=UPI0028B0DE36|nr:DUF3849 domain-containing protein [Anaerotignum sp.]